MIAKRLLVLVLLAPCCLIVGGCGGCGSDPRAAILRGRVGDFNDESEAPPPPTPLASDELDTKPPAPNPTPQTNPAPPKTAPSPTVAASPATPAPTTSPAAVTPAAPPEIYPSDLVPQIPDTLLPETSPVKVVVPPLNVTALSPLDRRARTIDNLRRIGMALNQYVARHGTLPPQAIRNNKGEVTLSWRVAILPQLGYDELYRQFRLFEAWDSPHNQQLLAQIPPELSSPERGDTTTNYIAVAAPEGAFGTVRGMAPKSFEDGAENTLIVVEVDDPQAIPWTRPADLALASSSPRLGLGKLRGDGLLAILGDGRVKRVPAELPDLQLRGLCTTDGAEPLVAADLLKEPTLEPLPVASVANDAVAELLASVPKSTAPSPSAALGGTTAPPDSALGRLPIPDEETLLKSRKLLRDFYGDAVRAARTPEERARLAVNLLGEATKVEASAADYFELVRIARDVATGTGDYATALKAAELIALKYQVDAAAQRLQLLRDLASTVRTPQGGAALGQYAKDLLLWAFDRDEFELTMAAYGLFVDYTKLKGDAAEVKRVQELRRGLEGAKQAYAAIPEQLKKLEADPNDADANEAVGKYLCLVKNRWDAGLPLLVRSGDVRLRIVATIDLEPIRTPQDTLKLADQYWEMAKDYKPPYTRGLHLRAIVCYQQAANQLAGSLDKIRAQKRLDEAIAIYGKEEIQRSLGHVPTGSGIGVSPVPVPVPVPGRPVGVPVPTSGPPRGVPVPGTSGG